MLDRIGSSFGINKKVFWVPVDANLLPDYYSVRRGITHGCLGSAEVVAGLSVWSVDVALIFTRSHSGKLCM